MRVVWIIALNTFREIIRDRILYGLVVFALLLIGMSLALGQLSFAEQIRISANFGFTGIHLSAVMLSIFAGGSLVAKEIDKKTIMTLLVRPISRLQFMLGKSIGLTLVVVSVVVGLAAVLALVLANMGFTLNVGFFLGLLGVLLESVVLLGLALFFSTFARPVMVASFVIGMFIIGHWLNSLDYFAEKSESPVFKGFGEVIVALFPNLETFNWRSLAIYGDTLEVSTVAMALLYAFVWYNLLLLAAALVIRKKDFG